ncbi:MAG: diol dehydratase small subunit [Actinomycetia bacterium]|nr:diol dehydratase small subunit [Actinomycetes bacterium]
MDQEQLVRQIMAEVLAALGNAPRSGATGPAGPGARVTKDDYPLGERSPELISSASGKRLADFSLDKVLSGEFSADDFRIAPQTLELQAQVAESDGRDSLARNLRRAAELTAVPDDQLLGVYNALRPYRSTKAELYAIADDLETKYHCVINAAFIREAADVYAQRGRLKAD